MFGTYLFATSRNAALAAMIPRYWASSKIEIPLMSEWATWIFPWGFSASFLALPHITLGASFILA